MTTRFRRARRKACCLLRRFGLERERQVPVEDIAFALGVGIVRGGLGGALASLVRVGRVARIRISDATQRPADRGFSVAHELGHHQLAHESALDAVGVGRVPGAFCDDSKEREANTFAAELMLPAQAVRECCPRAPFDWTAVQAVAQGFAAPLLATAIRITELHPERCALVFSQGMRVRWVVHSALFAPRIRIGQLSTAHRDANTDQWIDMPGANTVEHALRIPGSRGVASLLFVRS